MGEGRYSVSRGVYGRVTGRLRGPEGGLGREGAALRLQVCRVIVLTPAQSDEQTIAVRNGNACLTVASLPALRTASSTELFVPRTTTP